MAKISTLLADYNLSIDNLIQKELDRNDDVIPLVTVISNSEDHIIKKAISDLQNLDEVQGQISHIRILDI